MNELIPIEGDDQIHSGGQVYQEPVRQMYVDGAYLPLHQGRLPDNGHDNYADYVKTESGKYSLVRDRSNWLKINLQTEVGNSRRYHDWKGYDDIEPKTSTVIFFNDRKVGSVGWWGGDLLRHLLKVHEYIETLKNLHAFGAWTEEDILKEVGRQVDYDGYPAVIAETLGAIEAGEVLIYAPTWPDDGYDRGGRLRVSLDSHKIDWYPNLDDRVTVEVPNPLYG